MKVHVITAVASHNEVDGTSRFMCKDAFLDRTKAEVVLPGFVRGIEDDLTGFVTYCNVKAKIQELELVE